MLCYYCMKDKGNAAICGYCGHTNDIPVEHHQLRPGTVLGQKYVVGRVLGEGGFGITYIGIDTTLSVRVAIKEYFPHGYSIRDNERSNEISTGTGSNGSFYHNGLGKFLEEARNLANFSNESGIVNVRDFFEENNTAYIVMDYLEGVDLRHYLHDHGVLSAEEAFTLLRPIMQSLETVHRAGVIHRDISPDNIMVLHNGKLKLMDFGAAREYDSDNRSMSVMLKKGYAPEEQYHRKGEQGPWSDVYSLCATIYRCITGKVPEESLDRVFNDTLEPPSRLGIAISPALESVLMYGMAPHKADRCQNMTELMRLIDEAMAQHAPCYVPQPPVSRVRDVYATSLAEDARVSYGDPYSVKPTGRSYQTNTAPRYQEPNYQEPYYQEPYYQEPKQDKSKTALVVAIVALILAILIVGGVVAFLMLRDKDDNSDQHSGETSATQNMSVSPDDSHDPDASENENGDASEQPKESSAKATESKSGYVKDENGYPAYYENGVKKSHLGVDISAYQDSVDFNALKNAGVEFVIIRIGGRYYESGGFYTDDKFETYYSGARAAGLKVGVFFFSQAISTDEAKEEATFVLQHLDGKLIDYPITYDWENIDGAAARTDNITSAQVNQFAQAFCNTINSSGHRSIIYYNPSETKVSYDFNAMRSYSFWLADYADTPNPNYDFKMWQFTKTGSISGISGEVDIDLSLYDD